MFKRIALASSMFAATVGPAMAAPVPRPSVAPGAAQKRTEHTREYYQRLENARQPQAPENPIINAPQTGSKVENANAGPSFKLKAVKFSKSRFLKPQTLQAIAAPYIGHTVHVGALRKIVAAVNKQYVKRDIYTARAILPPQRITGGVVHIKLIEGRLGALQIRHNTHTRDGFIRSRIGQAQGEVVDGARLKRDLVFFNRTSDIQLRALLRPGEQPGLTRILLLAQEPDRFSVEPFIDNAGSTSTGRYRGGMSLRLFGLLGIDDRFNGYFVGSRGDLSGAVSYSLPVNHLNGRVGLSYSRNAINIVDGPFKQLNITGHSSTESLHYTQPLIATQRWLLTWASSVAYTKSVTEAEDQKIADSNTKQLNTGFSVARTSRHHRWSLTQTIGGMHSKVTLNNKHSFFLYDFDGDYLQAFGASPYLLSLSIGGQYAPADQLPSQALFQIGGISTVRGYEQGVIAGSSGFYGQLELHRRLRDWLGGFAFVDAGGVYQAFPASKYIYSSGLGFSISYHRWLNARFSAGFPLTTVTPDQDRYRLGFRIAMHWAP